MLLSQERCDGFIPVARSRGPPALALGDWPDADLCTGLVLAADFNTSLDKILANTYDRDTEGLC